MRTLIAGIMASVLSLSTGLALEGKGIFPEGTLPFVLNLSPQGDGVILQGSVPSKIQKEAISAAVVKALGEDKVENRLKLSPETINESWIDDLPGLITTFLESSPGEADFTVVDGKIILQGEIGDRKKYEILRGEISEEAPRALAVEDRITVGGVRMVSPEAVPEEPGERAIATGEEKVPPKMTIAAALEAPVKESASEKAVPQLSEPKRKLKYQGPVEVVERPTRDVVAATKASAPKQAAPKPVMAKAKEPNPARSETSPDRIPEKEVVDPGDHGSDPGGPLLFYFATGSAEILPEDRHKIDWAIGRCRSSRTILYVTGYADYRGSYALNRALTVQRTEKVRDAIFRGNVADDLKAELKAKGDEQSESRDAWSSKDSEAALQYSRRVVVETYRLK